MALDRWTVDGISLETEAVAISRTMISGTTSVLATFTNQPVVRGFTEKRDNATCAHLLTWSVSNSTSRTITEIRSEGSLKPPGFGGGNKGLLSRSRATDPLRAEGCQR